MSTDDERLAAAGWKRHHIYQSWTDPLLGHRHATPSALDVQRARDAYADSLLAAERERTRGLVEAVRDIAVLVEGRPDTSNSAVVERIARRALAEFAASPATKVTANSPAKLCRKYLGDNDGTCPQLTCIRPAGHAGLCDNVRSDDAPEADRRVREAWEQRQAFGAAVMEWMNEHRNCGATEAFYVFAEERLRCSGCGASKSAAMPPIDDSVERLRAAAHECAMEEAGVREAAEAAWKWYRVREGAGGGDHNAVIDANVELATTLRGLRAAAKERR